MQTSMIFKIIVGIAIILGGIFVVMRDDPAVPTGDINTIEPLPDQESQ
ncbi:hypothetical protein [uncultured Marinobacter sp.]|nr:hypothetical protein [uncultured Marinobacter sp.]MDX1598057.1 hypothetical protein [Marinobacter sp.]